MVERVMFNAVDVLCAMTMGKELQHTPQLRIVVGVGSCEVHF